MKIDKDKKRGLIGTIIVHALLFILLLFVALRTPLPLPGEEGVEVNLGYSDQGMGNKNSDEQPVKKQPAPVKRTIAPQPKEPTPVKEKIITQDVVDAPAIDEKKPEPKKVKEVKKEVDEKKEDVVKEEVVDKKPTKEVVDSIVTQEEITENIPVEDPKPKVIAKALYGGNSNKTGSDEGITNQHGNQGKPHGYKDSDGYTGQGGKGNGISFNLGGRGSLFLEQPSAKFKEQGAVVVNIWVDRDGKVINAQVRAKGTNILDPNLRKIAVDAALNSTFSKDANAAEKQRGTITYKFVLMK